MLGNPRIRHINRLVVFDERGLLLRPMMADIQEQTKLQTTVDEIGMIHRSVNYVLADVERKLSHQKANSPNAHHLQWKSACESIRIARAKVVSLLRREEAAISAYSAFRGELQPSLRKLHVTLQLRKA